MNLNPSDTRSDGNAAAEPVTAVGPVAAVGPVTAIEPHESADSNETVEPAESIESAESVAAVVDDIEAYLQRWLTRINRVLGHAYNLAYREDQVGRRENEIAQREIEDSRREQDLAGREHELQFRERQLAETTDEFRRLRERWAIQRDAEIEQMQQQVEELTEAWLRLEHQQRSSHSDNAPDHVDADQANGMSGPASVSGPANGSVLGGGSGPQPAVSGPATRTSHAASDVSPSGGERSASDAGRPSLPTPAPIPASLKGRQASRSSDQPPRSDNGSPAKISPADPAEPPPPRESSFQQFQQLQRELGRSSQTNR